MTSPGQPEVTEPAVGDELELLVGAVATGGGCVARAPDGRVVFVRHTLPGERVRAKVTETSRSYLRADAVMILEASPDRVEPRCPHAGPGRCGGCDYQHIELGAQRRLKATRVEEQLARMAGVQRSVVVEAVAGDTDGLGWRSRVRVAV
jgi:tRNA/tmRNA/rRNA uracil-C5-methylase (TrmA/RlmC/RlmD family)